MNHLIYFQFLNILIIVTNKLSYSVRDNKGHESCLRLGRLDCSCVQTQNVQWLKCNRSLFLAHFEGGWIYLVNM